ncbi:MAG: hypothetical protein P4L77_11790 [Sulfuriferula sp.]|nr:hypothetical protein [Sulfuriferula sp.]
MAETRLEIPKPVAGVNPNQHLHTLIRTILTHIGVNEGSVDAEVRVRGFDKGLDYPQIARVSKVMTYNLPLVTEFMALLAVFDVKCPPKYQAAEFSHPLVLESAGKSGWSLQIVPE